MTAPAVLAVDGGNSKTDVALVDGGGAVLGAARGPGASHHHLGVPAAMGALEALIGAAGLRLAGRRPMWPAIPAEPARGRVLWVTRPTGR